jgi:hypothetical protein
VNAPLLVQNKVLVNVDLVLWLPVDLYRLCEGGVENNSESTTKVHKVYTGNLNMNPGILLDLMDIPGKPRFTKPWCRGTELLDTFKSCIAIELYFRGKQTIVLVVLCKSTTRRSVL